ncbi:MAG: hypothetical protein EOO48_11100 [Flavobacterium sp.]|nr:MAG: hypothetical protein EOO48_11100 [Flavobacterium sp.]
MEFKATLDIRAKIITVAITALFIFLIAQPMLAISNNGIRSRVYIPVLLCAIYFGAFAFSPRKYSIADGWLTIHRIIGKRKIPLSAIVSIEVLGGGLPISLRTFGVHGLFGYFGTFYNVSKGSMNWYITRCDHAILIRTSSGRKIVVSPDDKEAFLQALKR